MIGHPTNADLTTSPVGLELKKRWEAYRANWYRCPAGVLTIGYGHTGRLPRGFEAPLSEPEATRLLHHRLHVEFEPCVLRAVTVPLNQNEFDALVSLVYNIGCGAFRSSTLLKHLNAERRPEAAAQFDRWVRGDGQVWPGLVARRKMERELFERPAAAVADDTWLEDAIARIGIERLDPMPILELPSSRPATPTELPGR